MSGPLAGVRVIELLGIGPGPFCGMLLADLGAEVIRVERPGPAPRGAANPAATNPAATNTAAGTATVNTAAAGTVPADVLGRGRRSLALDLKAPGAAEIVLALTDRADALIEGFRPGVAERLGVGPDDCLGRNRRLVYGRMTGWGQAGPYRDRAGHDINYISLAGALGQIGPAGGPPAVPLNLVGDFGGGGMLLAMMHAFIAAGRWTDQAGVNFLDGAAPYYTTYACADGRHVAVGALEDKFYAEWARTFEHADACVTPVLSMAEAAAHPHNAARATFVAPGGVTQPAPVPRFSATPAAAPPPAPAPGRDSRSILAEAGLADAEIDALIRDGTVTAPGQDADGRPRPDQASS